MFESQPRRSPFQSFQFWFVTMMGIGCVLGWSLNLISVPGTKVKLPAITDEPMPPPPDHGEIALGDDPNLSMAPEQNEAAASEEFAPFPKQTAPVRPSEVAEQPAPEQPKAEPEEKVAAFESSQAQATEPDTTSLVRTASAEIPAGGESESVRLVRAETHILKAAPEAPVAPIPPPEEIDLRQADRLIDSGDDVSAHRLLSSWYWKYPDHRDQLEKRLNLLARRIYFQPEPHYMAPYQVKFGDRLEQVAQPLSVSWEYLAKLNRVSPERLQAGSSLKVIQGPFQAVVDLSDFELTVHAHGYYVTRFKIGIGQDGATPTGTFRVIDKATDPTYYGPEGVVAHDDPANPLGERWLAINDEAGSLKGYGIHGTTDPNSIGKAESRGCLRLADRDIAELYDLLVVGSEVIIRP